MKHLFKRHGFLIGFGLLALIGFCNPVRSQTIPSSGNLNGTQPGGFGNSGFAPNYGGGVNNGINTGFIGGGYSGGGGNCGVVGYASVGANSGSSPQVLTRQQTQNGSVLSSESVLGVGNTQNLSAQIGIQIYSQKCLDPKKQLESQERINKINSDTQKYQTCAQQRGQIAIEIAKLSKDNNDLQDKLDRVCRLYEKEFR
jgi:hypothetical protein